MLIKQIKDMHTKSFLIAEVVLITTNHFDRKTIKVTTDIILSGFFQNNLI